MDSEEKEKIVCPACAGENVKCEKSAGYRFKCIDCGRELEVPTNEFQNQIYAELIASAQRLSRIYAISVWENSEN